MDRHSVYAGLNVVRLMMLEGQSPDESSELAAQLKRLRHLCAFEVADAESRSSSSPWWSLFDLADALLLAGKPGAKEKALGLYGRALSLSQEQNQQEAAISPLRTWRELLESEAMPSGMRDAAEAVKRVLEEATAK